jgi:hypothetical protein
VGRGPGRAVALVAGWRHARPGSAGSEPSTDGARPVRSCPRLRSRAAGGAGCRAVVRHRRPAVPPRRLSGPPAIRWRRSSQPGWAWTRNCRAWARADRRVPGQRERQGRTGPPRGWDRRCAPRAGRPQGRARHRAGRAGWRWPGRSGAHAISRSRRRYRAGEPRQEPRVPPESGPAPLRPGPAHATGRGPGPWRHGRLPGTEYGSGPSRRGRAPATWPGQDPSRPGRASPTWSRRVARDRALARRAGPPARRLALAPRPGSALPPRSRHPQPRPRLPRRHLLLRLHRLDPPPPQNLLPVPSNRWDQDPPPPDPAPRWGLGRW